MKDHQRPAGTSKQDHLSTSSYLGVKDRSLPDAAGLVQGKVHGHGDDGRIAQDPRVPTQGKVQEEKTHADRQKTVEETKEEERAGGEEQIKEEGNQNNSQADLHDGMIRLGPNSECDPNPAGTHSPVLKSHTAAPGLDLITDLASGEQAKEPVTARPQGLKPAHHLQARLGGSIDHTDHAALHGRGPVTARLPLAKPTGNRN